MGKKCAERKEPPKRAPTAHSKMHPGCACVVHVRSPKGWQAIQSEIANTHRKHRDWHQQTRTNNWSVRSQQCSALFAKHFGILLLRSVSCLSNISLCLPIIW